MISILHNPLIAQSQSLVTSIITTLSTVVTLLGSVTISAWFIFERMTYLRYEGIKSFSDVALDLLASGLGISNQHISKDTTVLKEQLRQNALDAFPLIFMAHAQPRAVLFTSASAHSERSLLPNHETAVLNLCFSPCGTPLVTSRYSMLYFFAADNHAHFMNKQVCEVFGSWPSWWVYSCSLVISLNWSRMECMTK